MDFLYMIIAAVPEGYGSWQVKYPLVSAQIADAGIDCTLVDSLGITREWGTEEGFTIFTGKYEDAVTIADIFHTVFDQEVVVIARIPAMVTFHTKGD